MVILVVAVLLISLSYSSARAVRGRATTAGRAPSEGVRFVLIVPAADRAQDAEDTAAALRDLAGDPVVVVGTQSVAELRKWAGEQEVDETDVVVGVVCPGDELSSGALVEVGGYFSEETTGAVQLAPRVKDAPRGLARVEDLDMALLSDLGSSRARLGALGLGGSGQFVRASDLGSIGLVGWPPAEDGMDLVVGAQLAAAGRRNHICTTSTVSHPAADGLGGVLARQKAWAAAHARAWREGRRLSSLTGAKMAPRRPLVAGALGAPIAAVVGGVLTVAVLAAVVVVATRAEEGPAQGVLANGGLLLLFVYLAVFGLAPLHGFVYWLRRERASLPGSLLMAHVHALVALLAVPWILSGLLSGLLRSR